MLFFKKNKKESDLLMAISGKLIPLEDVSDPVFSQRMMGDGFAIEPTAGKVYSPMGGKIITAFPTKHAIGLEVDNTLEILIHVGIDSVNLNGEGFTIHVKEGDEVKAGDLLLEFDLEEIRSKIPAVTTPIIFTKTQDHDLNVEYKDYEAKEIIKQI